MLKKISYFKKHHDSIYSVKLLLIRLYHCWGIFWWTYTRAVKGVNEMKVIGYSAITIFNISWKESTGQNVFDTLAEFS